MTIPAEIGDTLWTDYDWKFRTVPQEHLNNRNVALNQGKVVGGGTILNGMVWTRGSARDYDAWGDLNDVEGRVNEHNWRWEDLLPYFQKVRLGMKCSHRVWLTPATMTERELHCGRRCWDPVKIQHPSRSGHAWRRGTFVCCLSSLHLRSIWYEPLEPISTCHQ